MTTAVEQGAKLVGKEVAIGTKNGVIEAVRKGLPLYSLSTGELTTDDTVQFQLRLKNGNTWWSGSYPKQEGTTP